MKTVCISSVFSPPLRLWNVLSRNDKECQGKSSTEIQWLKPDPHAKFIKVSPSSLHPIQYFAQLYRERTNCLLHLCSLSLETPWRGYTGKPDYNSSSWSTLGPGPVEKLKATDPHPRKVHTPKHLVKFKTLMGSLVPSLSLSKHQESTLLLTLLLRLCQPNVVAEIVRMHWDSKSVFFITVPKWTHPKCPSPRNHQIWQKTFM